MIIIVDTPTNKRLTPDYSEIDLKQFKYKIIIDHHKKELSDDIINLDLRRKTAAATELFLQIFENDIQNDPKGDLLAEILLYGLIDDTEQYATPYTEKRTFSSVQKLIDLGADYRKALMNIISQPISHLKAISKLLSSLKLRDLGYHSSFIYNIDLPENRLHRYFILKDFKAKVRDASDIDLAIIYQERKDIGDEFEYSFRVRSLLGLKEFYKLFENSGGHSNAGGGIITAKNDDEVLKKIDEKVKEYFKRINHKTQNSQI
jgi:nanoRNase/pAp phosphatase (c-di-AMP/oligoRNAs hydrolase)